MEKLPTLKGLDLIHAWFDLPENDHRIPKDVLEALDETSTTIKELNKELENAENTYYSIKGELDNAKARIKELEANEQVLNDAHCKLMDKLDAAKPTWISVNDRLPKESDKDKFGFVLVMTLDGTCYTSEFDPEAIDPYGTNDDYRWFTGDIFLSNVTHWMPLPPPPKEEGK